MDRPLPDLRPFTHATVPMSASTNPIAASKADKLLMMGKNDVARAMIPSTKPAIPSPDFDSCGAGAVCTVLVLLLLMRFHNGLRLRLRKTATFTAKNLKEASRLMICILLQTTTATELQ